MCLSPLQRRYYVAARAGQSLAQPLAGLSLSPRDAHSFQDVHVCLEVMRMVVPGVDGQLMLQLVKMLIFFILVSI